MPTKQEIINIMESNLSEEVSPVAAMQRMPPPYTADRSNFDTYTDSSIYSAPPSNSYTNTPTTTTTYGSRSLLAKCHTCGGKNWTRLEYENGLMTHIIAAVLCLTTCSCCIPYCSKTCKVTRHYCSICGSYLGSNSKM